MSEAVPQETAESRSALLNSFYGGSTETATKAPEEAQESAEVEADSTGATVEAEATEVEQSTDTVDDDSSEVADDSETDEESLVIQLEDREITLAELREWEQGNMRMKDYTQKTQVLSEQKKALEGLQASYDEKVQQAEAMIEAIESLEAELPKPDLDYLRDTDPSEYLKQKEMLESRTAKMEKAKKDLAALKQKELNALVANEQKLLIESNPHWKDPKVMEAEIKLANDYILEKGFTSDEAAQLVNHKMINALRDAAKYEKLKSEQANVEKRVRKAPKVVKPAVRKTKPAQPKSVADQLYGKK